MYIDTAVPPAPVTDLKAFRVDASEIALSWTIVFDGYSPIQKIEVAVISEEVNLFMKPFEGAVNIGTISNLEPDKSYTFSVAVVNHVGTSDRMNITATTSECVYNPVV